MFGENNGSNPIRHKSQIKELNIPYILKMEYSQLHWGCIEIYNSFKVGADSQ